MASLQERDRIIRAVMARVENCRTATLQHRPGWAFAENCQTTGLLEALSLLDPPDDPGCGCIGPTHYQTCNQGLTEEPPF